MTPATLDGLVNFRDVGGMPATAGTIRRGVLYRSESVSSLSRDGRSELAASGIGTVVDFRSEIEVARMPGIAPDSSRPVLVKMPLLNGAMPTSLADLPSLDGIYRQLIQESGAIFARLASIVATGGEGVLVHCTAGKDRTGMGIALLLLAVGADRDAVLADYTLSTQNLSGPWSKRMLEGALSMGLEVTPEVEELVHGTSAEALTAALTLAENRFGSVSGYLLAHGLTNDDLSGLRARLLEGGA
ncbi:tyrosine-protein phosphatase [Arthrobacter sp. B2a2-09]|uniref:tyrosine-protein phosphatase n=1 Tax=Arthrobacter sp. B2a2-09 TaxID=2952822 RepID=UPI0022CD355D|nr:tyrosine-protein phosphatase [Arthrobacter sp. B2a2-09]MCZ9881633.1 tyrosine-protein phosphatase [Arthrobacter sp. B2a2-09]